MDAPQLAAIAGLILSLAFSYIPGLRQWYDAKSPGEKQMIMGGALVIVALGIFGIACAGLGAMLGIGVECTVAGAWGLVQILIAALIANQSTYLITRRRSPQR